MIVGIGVDLVDIARFERTIERTPRLLERLFAPVERALPLRSLAARYAAKEALIKALGGSDGVHWTEIEITSDASGRPSFTPDRRDRRGRRRAGGTTLHLSMSHDAGLATAYVIAEGRRAATRSAASGGSRRAARWSRTARMSRACRAGRPARGDHRRRRDRGQRAAPAPAHARPRSSRSSRPTATATAPCAAAVAALEGGAIAPRRRRHRRGARPAPRGHRRADPRVAARPGRLVPRGRRRSGIELGHLELRPAAAGGGRGIRRSSRRRAPQARDRPRPQRHRARGLRRASSPRPRASSASASCASSGSSATSRTPPPRTTARRCGAFQEATGGCRIRGPRAAAAAHRRDARGDRRCPRRASAACASASRSTDCRRSTTATSGDLGLRPAMTLRASVAAVRRVPAGPRRLVRLRLPHRPRDDPRARPARLRRRRAAAAPRAPGPVSIGGARFRVAGRIAMDQFVVDVGDHPVVGRRRGRAVRRPDARRALGRRVGGCRRHHQLRDRHAHRAARAAAAGVGVSGLDPLVGRHEIADARRHGGVRRADRTDAAPRRPRRAHRSARRGQDDAHARDRRRARRARTRAEPHVRDRADASVARRRGAARARRRVPAGLGARARRPRHRRGAARSSSSSGAAGWSTASPTRGGRSSSTASGAGAGSTRRAARPRARPRSSTPTPRAS